ncbi:50S ribosomal protein L25/general stress protein Ctc [Sphingomonas changnyeongensis]|uniref:Large ribosomal subunit protein bL25 n=1 Tax=Sphingomonas changnyeongensis TaxID=2698679 RepID=A0A7Z2NVM1_9SPHN|nr:50S ribosomal protein L25/general stress protein Ctc [Sphingomonas changnyeongensis]QHL90653.1 50S ribosomal protein L25/general stress protein Ctc [Sphingomonas changnyeongensis]
MSETLTLSAEVRERAGKGASRAIRREGRVPAVIYGNKEEPLGIHVEERALNKLLNTGHFMNAVVMIETPNGAIRTLPKDVQFHPVTDRPLHVDFLRIGEHSTVTVEVPVHFTNEAASPGLKRGGVLNIVRHEIELVVDAAEIPDEVIVDLAGYEVGDSIHVSQIKLPAGARAAIEDRDFTIATIIAPSGLKSSEGEAAEG